METITSDDILGKDAVDSEGEILGVVMKVHIDKRSKELLGITIDQGFMKPDLYMGIQFVKNFGIDTVFLNDVPHNKFVGLEVLSAEGKSLGFVKDIHLKNHKIDEIIVTHSVGFSKKDYSISASHVKELGSKVILKKGFRPQEA